jgi:hypothetical protein
MGMLLRRHERTADRQPKVNGKPVKQEPKNKSLTPNTAKNNTNARTPERD